MSEISEYYGVILMRSDGNHIIVKETENYEEAHKKWTEMREHWVKCLHEKLPFVVESPIVTAFDPNFVYEIVIKPKTTKTKESMVSNPYHRDMLAKGFTNTFPQRTGINNSGLLDEGYQY